MLALQVSAWAYPSKHSLAQNGSKMYVWSWYFILMHKLNKSAILMDNILACEYIPYFMVSVGYLFKIISNLPEMNRYIIYNSGTM